MPPAPRVPWSIRAQVTPLAQVIVAESEAALARAAQDWRGRFDIPVIGVAGSNGKTTVKEMMAAILARSGACLATRGNLNNHIGVPLTLLRLGARASHRGHRNGREPRGDVAAWWRSHRPPSASSPMPAPSTWKASARSRRAARAEGEMVAALPAAGTAVINADDPFAPLWRGLTRAQVVSFGLSAAAAWRAQDLHCDVDAEGFATRFTLHAPWGACRSCWSSPAATTSCNALGAAAAAAAAGATLEHIAAGLAAMRAGAGRLQFKRAASGAWLIDDSYNANPSSVRAGIEVLAQLDGRRWLVFGDMAELGDFAPASHAEIGEFARAQRRRAAVRHRRRCAWAVESFGAGGAVVSGYRRRSPPALSASANSDVRMLIKGRAAIVWNASSSALAHAPERASPSAHAVLADTASDAWCTRASTSSPT